jgi:hypothetical protein
MYALYCVDFHLVPKYSATLVGLCGDLLCRLSPKTENPVRHLLTYFLTPWIRVLLEKLTGSVASQEILRIFGTRRSLHRTHKRPPPVPILSQLHPVPKNYLPLPEDPS